MTFSIKKKGGYLLPETTLKNKAETEVTLIKRGFEILILKANKFIKMKSKEELKKLFENGDKPTQEDFWEWQDSYWHKDEKLPTEAAGIYKIKGSIADLAALNAITGMSEGDVYNIIDSGDNYVYVSDIDNTGVAGWDKLSSVVDFSNVVMKTGDQFIEGEKTFDTAPFIPNAIETDQAMSLGQLYGTGLWSLDAPSTTNLNAIDRTCFLRINSNTLNRPFDNGTVLTQMHQENQQTQIAIDLLTGEIWTRAKNNNLGWSDWKKSGTGNFLPLSGGALTGGGVIEDSANIIIKQNDNGIDVKGISWNNKNGSGTPISGIGSFTNNGDFVYHYVGWSSTPWEETNCFYVSEDELKWKNQDVMQDLQNVLNKGSYAESSDGNSLVTIAPEQVYFNISFNDGQYNRSVIEQSQSYINFGYAQTKDEVDSDGVTPIQVNYDRNIILNENGIMLSDGMDADRQQTKVHLDKVNRNFKIEHRVNKNFGIGDPIDAINKIEILPDAMSFGLFSPEQETNYAYNTSVNLEGGGGINLYSSYRDLTEGTPTPFYRKTALILDPIAQSLEAFFDNGVGDVPVVTKITSKGITSNTDFSNTMSNLDFVQRKFVVDKINNLINQINSGVHPIPNIS